ncbi:hypothetical protein ANN_20647 [Periplaneta americana]|uniref:Uncharacterized protein n=1 Tax=Periplaneta americana TaxID=6978 RepID=A0ABQ8SDG6_PERAM|nr:hypothetical protein ANN_20647 [Periplaneta americana]
MMNNKMFYEEVLSSVCLRRIPVSSTRFCSPLYKAERTGTASLVSKFRETGCTERKRYIGKATKLTEDLVANVKEKNAEEPSWLFNDAVSTTRLFSVDEIGDSEMIFGESESPSFTTIQDNRRHEGVALYAQQDENYVLDDIGAMVKCR